MYYFKIIQICFFFKKEKEVLVNSKYAFQYVKVRSYKELIMNRGVHRK